MGRQNKRLVFVSHAGSDTWIAKRMAELIEVNGAITFLDEAHVSVGDDFEERILQGLDDADELVVLLTPASLGRPYIWAEVGAVWGKRKRVVGVLHGVNIQELANNPAVPGFIKAKDLIQLNDFDQYLSELARRISSGEA